MWVQAEQIVIADRSRARRGVTLLLALLTLLCAICPLGLPASQARGSAFNPANESVTVRPEAAAIAQVAAERLDPPAFQPVLATGATPLLAVALVPVAATAARPRAPPAATPFSARAPPARA